MKDGIFYHKELYGELTNETAEQLGYRPISVDVRQKTTYCCYNRHRVRQLFYSVKVIKSNKLISQSGINKVIIFYSILFYSILFYSILFYRILF